MKLTLILGKLFTYIIFLIPTSPFAQAIQSTTGNCSPIVNNVQGNVSIQCINKDVEKKILRSLELHIQPVAKQLRQLDDTTSQNAEALRGLQEKQNIIQTTLDRVTTSNAESAKELSAIQRQSMDRLDSFSKDLEQIRKEYQLNDEFASTLLKQAQEEFNQHLKSIETNIDGIEARLELMQKRVDKLAIDVDLLMQKFLQGQLEDSVYFYGLTIGKEQRQSLNPTLIALELEMLTSRGIGPFQSSSLYASIGKMSATSRNSYETFNGAVPIVFSDDNSATRVTAGIRSFGTKSSIFIGYIGFDTSYYIFNKQQGKDRLGISISTGVEMASRNSRSALQIAANCAPSVSTDFLFNNIGNSTLIKKQHTNCGWMASFRTSFH